MHLSAISKSMVILAVTIFTILALPVFSLAQNAFTVPSEIANKPNVKVVQTTGGQPGFEFTGSDGRTIGCMVIPGSRPPAGWANKVETAITDAGVQTSATTAVLLPDVPAFDWCYGCAPTTGSMLMGYYDRNGFPSLYTGPANGGVTPINNSIWGYGENPISATHIGIDGRVTYGHVEDYWDPVFDVTDPYQTAGRTAHADDCVADFMGTSSGTLTNGSTYYYYYGSGDPYYPDTDKEVAYGLAGYLNLCGVGDALDGVYNQLIQGQGSDPAKGFTFAQYKAEIDAGRPVFIHVSGHTMLGVGYDDPATVYLHTTWDHTQPTAGLTTHMMTWGGKFLNMQHMAVTVLHLINPDSTPPTVISASPVGIDVDTDESVIINFSEPMKEAATAAAFSISPSVSGTISWLNDGATLELIPDSMLANETTYTVTVTTGAQDVAGNALATQYQWEFTTGVGYRADGLVYDATSATYLGDDIYNSDGTSQTITQSVAAGSITTFYARMQNDGMNDDWMKIQGIEGTDGWTIKYIDSADGTDITQEVIDGTWYSLQVATGCTQAIKIVVTAGPTVSLGTPFEIPLQVSSWWNPDEIDVIKFIPTVMHSYKPDALVYDDDTAGYIGDDIYNITGQWQTESHEIMSGATTTYLASYQNDGFRTDALKLRGTAGSSTWEIKYIDNATETDITADVTGSGWTTASLAAGESGVIRIEVTPALTVPNNTTYSLNLIVGSVSTTSQADVVKFMTTTVPNYQTDAQVYQFSTGSFIGDAIYNSTGENQTESRSAIVGARLTFYVKGQNDGNIDQQLVFKGNTAPAGWTVRYLDSATNNDITADVISTGWYTTSAVPVGSMRSIKVEMTPSSPTAFGTTFDNLVTVCSSIQAEINDTVKCSMDVPYIYRPDILPYQATTASYIGNNIYNDTGLNQTETRTINAGARTTYYARVQNDGNLNESLLVFGPAGNELWGITYIDSANGNDITALVTGSGWETDVINKGGGTRSLKIIITASPTLSSAAMHEVNLTVMSSGDNTKSDTGVFQTTIW